MLVTIIADASYCPNSKAGGYGFWVASSRGKEGGGGQFRHRIATSTTAEVCALVNALHTSLGRLGLVQQGDKILMQTDCLAAINTLEGKRSGTLNSQEKEALSIFRNLCRQHNLTYEFRHVRGHTRVADARSMTNRICDTAAREHMTQARVRFGWTVSGT